MYPLHLKYTTILPCKTISMKITIFIIVLVLKANENMEIWHFRLSQLANSSKPGTKTVYFKTCPKCPPQAFTQARSFFYKAQYGLVDGVMWQIIPYCLQDFLQLVDGIWLGLKRLVAFKHSFPDMVMKRIKVWWVWCPFVFSYEVTAVDGYPVLSQLRRVSRWIHCILLDSEKCQD